MELSRAKAKERARRKAARKRKLEQSKVQPVTNFRDLVQKIKSQNTNTNHNHNQGNTDSSTIANIINKQRESSNNTENGFQPPDRQLDIDSAGSAASMRSNKFDNLRKSHNDISIDSSESCKFPIYTYTGCFICYWSLLMM